MQEPIEVQLARIDERMKSAMGMMEKQNQALNEFRGWTVNVDSHLVQLGNRVGGVERSLATTVPTIDEFVVMKHKVMGAGVLGRWVWVVAAGTIGFIYGAKEQIIAWFTRGVP